MKSIEKILSIQDSSDQVKDSFYEFLDELNENVKTSFQKILKNSLYILEKSWTEEEDQGRIQIKLIVTISDENIIVLPTLKEILKQISSLCYDISERLSKYKRIKVSFGSESNLKRVFFEFDSNEIDSKLSSIETKTSICLSNLEPYISSWNSYEWLLVKKRFYFDNCSNVYKSKNSELIYKQLDEEFTKTAEALRNLHLADVTTSSLSLCINSSKIKEELIYIADAKLGSHLRRMKQLTKDSLDYLKDFHAESNNK